jgi:hypothetical protein
MPRDVSGKELLNLMKINSAPMRAEHYRQEAEKFRQMAKTETDQKLRHSLLELAGQYRDMAANIIPTECD